MVRSEQTAYQAGLTRDMVEFTGILHRQSCARPLTLAWQEPVLCYDAFVCKFFHWPAANRLGFLLARVGAVVRGTAGQSLRKPGCLGYQRRDVTLVPPVGPRRTRMLFMFPVCVYVCMHMHTHMKTGGQPRVLFPIHLAFLKQSIADPGAHG